MKISAIIVDENGPLHGATLGIPGSDLKAISDENGNVSMENDLLKPESVLRVDFIGYESHTSSAAAIDGSTITMSDSPIPKLEFQPIGEPPSLPEKAFPAECIKTGGGTLSFIARNRVAAILLSLAAISLVTTMVISKKK